MNVHNKITNIFYGLPVYPLDGHRAAKKPKL